MDVDRGQLVYPSLKDIPVIVDFRPRPGLLLGGVQMLVRVGQADVAERVHNAWLKTIEDGVHTYDIFTEGVSTKKEGTQAFAAEVIARLGQRSTTLRAADYAARPTMRLPTWTRKQGAKKEIVGIDVFVHAPGVAADALAATMKQAVFGPYDLAMITNRGVKVSPRRFTRDLLHRSLAMPLHGGARQAAPPRHDRRTARPPRKGRSRLHQDGTPLHIRRRAGDSLGKGQ